MRCNLQPGSRSLEGEVEGPRMTLRGRSQVTVVGDEKCRRNKQISTGAERERRSSRAAIGGL